MGALSGFIARSPTWMFVLICVVTSLVGAACLLFVVRIIVAATGLEGSQIAAAAILDAPFVGMIGPVIWLRRKRYSEARIEPRTTDALVAEAQHPGRMGMKWSARLVAISTGAILGLFFGYAASKPERVPYSFLKWFNGEIFGYGDRDPLNALIFAALGAIAVLGVTYLRRNSD